MFFDRKTEFIGDKLSFSNYCTYRLAILCRPMSVSVCLGFDARPHRRRVQYILGVQDERARKMVVTKVWVLTIDMGTEGSKGRGCPPGDCPIVIQPVSHTAR